MDGTLTRREGHASTTPSISLRATAAALDNFPLQRLRDRFRRLLAFIETYNPIERAQKNVAHHYDLSGALYDLFLDDDRQYSCAYFRTDNDSLEVAQHNKKPHIAAKLLLKPGQKVLDIGSGWGGLGLYLAQTRRCRCHRRHALGRAAEGGGERAPRPRAWPIASASTCATTARSRASTTASSPSACSSMSASATTASSSPRCATC